MGERLGPAPPELVEYLHLDNAANGFPEQPRASRPSAEFMADIESYRNLVLPGKALDFVRQALGPVEHATAHRDLQVRAGPDLVQRVDHRPDVRQVLSR